MQINNKKNYLLLDFMDIFFFWYSSPAAIFEYVLRKFALLFRFFLYVLFCFSYVVMRYFIYLFFS